MRNRPQRNPVHTFTVDRHLVETATRAAAHTRDVSRPDLLLIGALLHDIGKGWPGDHSRTGAVMARDIGERLGLDAGDVRILETVVRHHLLLPETATRRDLDDPVTIETVAETVGEPVVLETLAALAIADGQATGPAAWGAWKAGLVAELVRRVAAVLGDQARLPAPRRGPAGGLAVGDGQRREGLQDDGLADGMGDRLNRHRIVEVAARRRLRQQQVVACDGLQDPHVAGVETEPLPDVARGPRRSWSGRRASPCRCRGDRADQQEVRA